MRMLGLALIALPSILATPPLVGQVTAPSTAVPGAAGTIALVNGQWFNGTGFEPRTMYVVEGRFSSTAPARVERTTDLSGSWIVPPFGEAHNHNVDGAVEARTRQALARYVADGVFYVKIQGNYPLTDELRQRLPMNRPDGPDVLLAQAFVTASGGHPIQLHEDVLFAQGYYPGLEKSQLRDRLYVTLDSADDLAAKWATIRALRPDFIKANLWGSDEFDKRRADPRYVGMRGLAPALLRLLVERAHQDRLRVSVHISSAADFHNAVTAGVDEIVHSGSPSPINTIDNGAITLDLFRNPAALGAMFVDALAGRGSHASIYRPIAVEDAKLAAERGIVVVTTIQGLGRTPEGLRGLVRTPTAANLRVLRDNGVRVVVGSDNPMDTSMREFEQLATLDVWDRPALLRMWAETTPRAIFPERRIGLLQDGYEASFLALAGNPLEDLANVRRINLRFKQGVALP